MKRSSFDLSHLHFIFCFCFSFCYFRYENKYVKFFKSKPDLPPGLNPSEAEPPKQQQQQQQKIPGADGEMSGLSKSAKRNMKRKEKRKQQQQHQGQDGDADVESASDAVENVSISDSSESNKAAVSVSVSSPGDSSAAAAEKAKKIKNLKKKLRQVEDLQQKVDSGEIKELTKDQLEKLGRAKALLDELQQLEHGS